MSLVLYHYWRSSASWRVRWALELKAVSVELRAVDLLQGQEKQASYLRENPSGYVPCLIDGEFHLGESLAIIEWLEEKYPQRLLLPKEVNLKAKARQIAETVNAGIQPLQNVDVQKKVSSDKEAQAEWTKHWIVRGMTVLEKLLTEIPGERKKFCIGSEPTIADLCLIPQCYAAARFGVNLADFPRCQAIYEYARSTPECARASPEAHQPKS